MMRLLGGATVVAIGAMLAPVAALAQTPGLVNARVEISAAVAGSSATLEAIERQANARDRVRQQEIAALQGQLVEAEARGAAEMAGLQAQLVEAREALVADLSARDRAYAEEIAVFRREVTDIAATPEGAAALARFNAGDHVGAIAVLDRLIEAEDAARQTRANIESAAARRRVASLAMDARGKSDPAFDTDAVITRYEQLVQLDPGEPKDWDQLARLYIAAGRRADALAAAERLEALAADDQDRSTALVYRADLLWSEGDNEGALGLYRRSLEISERVSAADPASADLAINVSLTLIKIGDVLFRGQGDDDGALGFYRRSLEIAERLSAADPASADLASNVSLSLIRIGDVLSQGQGDYDGALVLYRRSLEIAERVSAADPASADLARHMMLPLQRIAFQLYYRGDSDGALVFHQRNNDIAERLSAADPASAERANDVAISLANLVNALLLGRGDRDRALALYRREIEILERLSAADPASVDRAGSLSNRLEQIGDVLFSQGDSDGALGLYRRMLEIAERQSAADPASVVLAGNVSAPLKKIGDVLLEQGDSDGALRVYRRMLEINERLSAADPASAVLAGNVSVSLDRIGAVLLSQGDGDGALGLYRRSLEIRERLSSADPGSAELATNVIISLDRIGDVLVSQGDYAGALELAQRSLEIRERLWEGTGSIPLEWPVRGDILRPFELVSPGVRNSGINIGAPADTAVNASAPGRVAYVGDDLVGQRLTVLIVHEDGWRTVYTHLGSTTVAEGAEVQAGQKIGTVGLTAGDGRPSIHFEIWQMQGDEPVAIDPLTVLPGQDELTTTAS